MSGSDMGKSKEPVRGGRNSGGSSKGLERGDGDGVGLGKKAGNRVEGASGAGGRQWCSSATGGERDGGAEYVGTGPGGSGFVGSHPTTKEPNAGRTMTGVPASVPKSLVTVAASAASRPAAATAVPRPVDGPCPVVDGTTDEARRRNRQAQLKQDIRKLEEWRRNEISKTRLGSKDTAHNFSDLTKRTKIARYRVEVGAAAWRNRQQYFGDSVRKFIS